MNFNCRTEDFGVNLLGCDCEEFCLLSPNYRVVRNRRQESSCVLFVGTIERRLDSMNYCHSVMLSLWQLITLGLQGNVQRGLRHTRILAVETRRQKSVVSCLN
jgi:hypothetical protein